MPQKSTDSSRPARALSGLALVLAVLLLALAAGPAPASGRGATCKRTCVDLDANCGSTTTDALASLRVVVGLFVPYVSGNSKLMDASRDGNVTIRDSLLLLKRVVGSIAELPCEVPVNPTSTTTSTT